MRTVYVVQQPLIRRQSPDIGEVMVNKFDVSSAKFYGRIQVLLEPFTQPTREARNLLNLALINYTPADFILTAGNPTLIGWATAIAAFYGQGTVSTLQWDRTAGCYRPIRMCLFPTKEDVYEEIEEGSGPEAAEAEGGDSGACSPGLRPGRRRPSPRR